VTSEEVNTVKEECREADTTAAQALAFYPVVLTHVARRLGNEAHRYQMELDAEV
jgi:hypothetical protein